MIGSKVRRIMLERIALSGLKSSATIGAVNALLDFGAWLRKNQCNTIFRSRYELYQYINNHFLNNVAIDYLEFGVHRGESIAYWAKLNQNPTSRFFGFDSFEGLPEDWRLLSRTMPKGTFNTDGQVPDFSDQRVKFIKGLFQEVSAGFLENFSLKNKLIIHCDADLYNSTMFVLTTYHQLIVPGTILIFDNFSTVTHGFRAFRDYTGAFLRGYKLAAICKP